MKNQHLQVIGCFLLDAELGIRKVWGENIRFFKINTRS